MKIRDVGARSLRPVLIVAIWAMVVGCSQKRHATTFDGFALGTIYSVTIIGEQEDGLQERVDSLFVAADNSMSIFNPNSRLSRLNRNETDSVDRHIEHCVEIARRISELSEGAYDITIQPLIEAYGFAAKSGGQNVNVDSLLQFVGYEKMRIENGRLVKERPEIRIDLNSIAKGYIVDLVAELLEGEGYEEYLVNIGGEIVCRGKNAKGKDWVVGIETPAEGNFVEGASMECRIAVSDLAVATSGNYRNFRIDRQGNKITHIVDPRTGISTISRLLSASVIAESCVEADALATMFIVLGADGAKRFISEHPDIAALFIISDEKGEMKTEYSEAMQRYIKN